MSAAEILHRSFEMVKRQIDRFRLPISCRDYGTLPAIPALKRTLEKWTVSDALLLEWKDLAENAQEGNFHFLGQQWPHVGHDQKWHFDPVSKHFWPKEDYCFSIDYRHPTDKGDAKYVWELNRLQYLQPIAALANKTNNITLSRFCWGEIESWIDCNRPHKGINWCCGIELALRVLSIIVVCSLVGEHATHIQRKKVWRTLREHGFWLARYPSRFSSANNHMAAEALGLFALGALCPQLPEAQSWHKRGWTLLQQSAEEQIHSDGSGAEQSPHYASVLLEMLLVGYYIAQGTGMAVPASYTQRMLSSAHFLRWFVDANGNVPRIGDDDQACIVGPATEGDAHILSTLGCVSSLFNQRDLAPPAYALHLRNALFGLPPTPSLTQEGMHSFEEGGYTVGRHYYDGHEIWCAVDHGPLGFLSIAAHGHADALSVWLHLDGEPVLVDSGTYLYHSGREWRDYFRGTLAHNTLCLDEENSSIISGPFNWSHKAKAHVNLLETGQEHWQLDATHDGYLSRFGVLHRRRVSLTPKRGLTIEDQITGESTRSVMVSYHLHPSLTACWDENEVLVQRGDKRIMRVRHLGPLALSIAAPGDAHCSWYSARFGHKEPATRLILSGKLAPSAKVVTDFSFIWS